MTDGHPTRRVALVAAALTLAALVCAGLGMRAERASAVNPASGRTESSPATPLFSARRSPDVLTGPQARRRLAVALAPVIDTAPANTCVTVSGPPGTLFEHRPDVPMTPASNQKLLTARAALDVLGGDSTRTTTVAAADDPADGTVEGDLYFIGGGDPLIDSLTYQAVQRYGPSPHTSLEELANAVAATGLTAVTGSVVGDATRYDDARTVASWPDRYVTQDQVGPLSALAVNDSKTYSVLEPGSAARPADDPAAYAASSLTDLLVARGVSIGGAPRSGTAPDEWITVVEQPSLTVSAMVGEMLTFSDNNTAELLVKEMAVTAGTGNSTEAGLAAMNEALTGDGLAMEGAVLVDGSGLDVGNLVSCRMLDDVLRADGPDGPIESGLAVAGESGTLSDRFANSPAAGKVRAKTGTLNSVSALSGWATADSGDELSFAILVNVEDRRTGPSDQAFQERIAEALLTYPNRVDPALLRPVAADG